MRAIILFLLFVSGVAVANESPTIADDQQSKKNYFEDRERGWYWYEKQPEPVEKKEKEKPEVVTAPAQPVAPREILKQQGEQWEDALATAILNPSLENYQAYLAMTSKIQKQSQEFATGFKQAIWVSPEYDYTLTRPVTTQAIVARNEQERAEQDKALAGMSQQNGLIFFFRGDCQYCHRFAPVLKKFAEHYGFTIIPVSLDGGSLPEFPYPKRNYDLGRKLNVDVVPALFMVNPDSNSVVTVGYGYSDWTVLTQKLLFAGQQLAKR